MSGGRRLAVGPLRPLPRGPSIRPLDALRATRLLLPWCRRRPLFVFDFDGTLAPLQPDRDAVHLPIALKMNLRRLARRWPVAVVSGRGRADLHHRLGRGPWRTYGSHGAEGVAGGDDRRALRAFAGVREWCRHHQGDLAAAGLDWEDKGRCAALHAAPGIDLHAAMAWLQRAYSDAAAQGSTLHMQAGHRVINLTAPGAPDKGDAARHALLRSGARALLVWGDDANDEPAFAVARRHGLAFRVGRAAGPSTAAWQLPDCDAVHRLVKRLLRLPPRVAALS